MKRRKSRFVKTATEFEESIMAYLGEVEAQNKPRFVVYDIETGDEYSSKDAARESGVKEHNIKSEFEKVPIFDLVRPTLSSYCAFMGMSMGAYYTLEDQDDESAEISEWFRTLLESEVEQLLINPSNRNSNGAIFMLKNRHQWTDKTEVEHSGTQGIELVYDLPKTETK